jgi:hypothetical protein
MPDKEKKCFSIYLDPDTKTEIEDFFLKCKIKNYNEGYRKLIDLGFKEFKKIKKEEK